MQEILTCVALEAGQVSWSWWGSSEEPRGLWGTPNLLNLAGSLQKKERKTDTLEWQDSIKTKALVPLRLTETEASAAVVALTNFIRRALRWLRFCPEARGVNQQLTAPAHLSPCFHRVGFAIVSSSWSLSTNHSLKSSQRRTQRSKIWQHVASLGLLHRSQCVRILQTASPETKAGAKREL